MDSNELTRLLEDCGALQTGHFLLSSGKHSDRYVQCAKLLQYPALAGRVGAALGALFDEEPCDVVVSPALGGVLIGHEVARYLGTPFLFTERADGKMTFRRGLELEDGARVLIIEDVVTTGKSVLEVRDAVEASRASVLRVGAIIDRRPERSFPLPFKALLQVEASAWNEDEVPEHVRSIPVSKPGSRPQPQRPQEKQG